VNLTAVPYLGPRLRTGEDMHSSLHVHGMQRDCLNYLIMTHMNLERDIPVLISHAD
jgi:hypothetical protein